MARKDKTTVLLDRELAREAGAILGTTKTTETINEALAHVVREQKLRKLARDSIAISREVGPEQLAQLRAEAWQRSRST